MRGLALVFAVLCCVAAVYGSVKISRVQNQVEKVNEPIPTMAFTYTSSGLEYYIKVLAYSVAKRISHITIPPVHGWKEVAVGNITYTLSDITISKLIPGDVTVILTEPNILVMRMTGASAAMTLSWEYKDQSFPYVGDSGTADVTLDKLMIQGTSTWTVVDGRPAVDLNSELVNIDGLDIVLHGGASWIYNFLLGVFHQTVLKMAQDAISKAVVNDFFTSINRFLRSSFPLEMHLGDGVGFYSSRMLRSCKCTNTYVQFYLDGEVQLTNHTGVHYSGTRVMPADLVANDPSQFYTSDFFFNSMWFAYHRGGYLSNLEYGSADLPMPRLPKFNTANFARTWPGLSAAFPNTDFTVLLNVPTPPNTLLIPGMLETNITGTVDVMVRGKSVAQLSVNVILLQTVGKVVHCFYFRPWFQSSLYDFSYKVVSSTVGNPTGGFMQDMNMYAAGGITHLVDQFFLSRGFGLPTLDGKVFPTQTWKYGDGWMGWFGDDS